MIRGLDSSISALNAFQKKADTAANNIANSQSDGFKAQRVTISDNGLKGGVTTAIEEDTSAGPQALKFKNGEETLVEMSNVNLVTEMTDLLTAKRGFEMNIKAVQTGDEMLGTLLDIKK